MVHPSFYNCWLLQTLVIKNEDLTFISTIGEGHFGIVDKMSCKGTSMAVKVNYDGSFVAKKLNHHYLVTIIFFAENTTQGSPGVRK